MSKRKKTVSRQKSGGRRKPTSRDSPLAKLRGVNPISGSKRSKNKRESIAHIAIKNSIGKKSIGWTPADEYQFLRDSGGALVPVILKDHCEVLAERINKDLKTDARLVGKGITATVSSFDDITDMRSTTIMIDYTIPDPSLLERDTIVILDHGTVGMVGDQLQGSKSKEKVYPHEDGSETYTLYYQVENEWGTDLSDGEDEL
jgi:hypothetical protein